MEELTADKWIALLDRWKQPMEDTTAAEWIALLDRWEQVMEDTTADELDALLAGLPQPMVDTTAAELDLDALLASLKNSDVLAFLRAKAKSPEIQEAAADLFSALGLNITTFYTNAPLLESTGQNKVSVPGLWG